MALEPTPLLDPTLPRLGQDPYPIGDYLTVSRGRINGVKYAIFPPMGRIMSQPEVPVDRVEGLVGPDLWS